MKRWIAAAAALCLLTGCAPLLERSYSTAEPHSSKYWESEAAGTLRAENDQDIVNDLLILIGQHTGSATLRLYNFPDDQAAAEAMERAALEVQQETALGAYAAEYITYVSQSQRSCYEVDVQIGYIETHGRAGTEALMQGLPVIPRRKIFYKGKELEEMDVDAIIRLHPEIVIVDELAHTNVEGSLNEKRWQDVITLLDEGINVISAINIQHIESVNEEVQEITGIEVKERVPDSVLQEADEVVNIDLTAEELIARLKAGKIYRPEKIQTALDNFFRTENILQLRELALKEVALRVEKKVENEVMMGVAVGLRHEKFMACISSHEKTPRRIIRKAAKLATRYNTTFIALYVQTPKESMDRIDLASQRYLLNHFKLVAELGGEVVQVQSKDILGSIVKVCKEKQISTVCMGTPNLRLPYAICSILGYRKFLNNLSQANVDLIILA